MRVQAVLLLALSAVLSTHAYDNGVGLKPFLGWQSWCAVGKCGTDACYDRQIRSTAKAMVDNGMKDLGFEWVVIDDCWCVVHASGHGDTDANKHACAAACLQASHARTERNTDAVRAVLYASACSPYFPAQLACSCTYIGIDTLCE